MPNSDEMDKVLVLDAVSNKYPMPDIYLEKTI
jgi:hypothetical protein